MEFFIGELKAGKEIGSSLIGQPFSAPQYLWPRPSATAEFGYNPSASGGSKYGASLRYVFGGDGERPEMNLSVPREKISMSQSAAGQTINFPTGNTVYSVSSGFMQATDGKSVEAGVDVQVGGRHVARVTCRPGTVQDSMEGLKLLSCAPPCRSGRRS